MRNVQHKLPCISRDFPEKQNQHTELAQEVMEAGKSQDLHGERESWCVRRASGVVPGYIGRTENQEN